MKNIASILWIVGIAGAGFAVYWFALRPQEAGCTDCDDQTQPNLKKMPTSSIMQTKDPTIAIADNPKFRDPFTAPPKIRANVENAL